MSVTNLYWVFGYLQGFYKSQVVSPISEPFTVCHHPQISSNNQYLEYGFHDSLNPGSGGYISYVFGDDGPLDMRTKTWFSTGCGGIFPKMSGESKLTSWQFFVTFLGCLRDPFKGCW